METEVTKKYKKRAKWLRIISSSLTVLPLIIYSIIGLVQGPVTHKVTLSLTLIVCIVFTLITTIFKHRIRSTIWILLLGIYMCMKNITPLLIIIAISTILDEFVIEPQAKKYKQKYIINNEIDERS